MFSKVLGCLSYCFESKIQKIGTDVKLQVVKKTALLRTVKILREMIGYEETRYDWI